MQRLIWEPKLNYQAILVDTKLYRAYDINMSSEVISQQSIVNENLSPMQAGAKWLSERGVNLDVAGIQLVGPRPECRGTLAEMVAVVGHSAIKDQVESAIDNARKLGEDPSQAVLKGIEFFAARDDEGKIMRVELGRLKKK